MSIDREQRNRLIWRAEAYERRTKQKGRPAGALRLTGLAVLRTIAFRFMNVARGAAWPSYDAIQRATGFCRSTIAEALKRLEAAGFLRIERRAGWHNGRIVRETNIYRMPVSPPSLPPESLDGERQPKPLYLPYDLMTGPLKNALEKLGERVRALSA